MIPIERCIWRINVELRRVTEMKNADAADELQQILAILTTVQEHADVIRAVIAAKKVVPGSKVIEN